MPASGLSGWIDEGIVYWMASNFAPLDPFDAKAKLPRIFESLSAANPHEPGVGDMAYRLAVTFIRHLDHALADDGGLRPLLRSFFAEYQHKVVDRSSGPISATTSRPITAIGSIACSNKPVSNA
jgi:hypothetical protein